MPGAVSKKYFCGRPVKFNLSAQVKCDAKGRFLNVSIGYLGSRSNCLAFVASSLHTKPENPGFLAPGLVLFGDNVHISKKRMEAPFKFSSAGSKDARNFYHYQCRIHVACSCMLVHRWAILRKPIPAIISLQTCATLTCCLRKLKIYCLDENEGKHYEQTKINPFYSSITRSINMIEDTTGKIIPEEMLRGGEYSDVYDRRKLHSNYLPRDHLLEITRKITCAGLNENNSFYVLV